jgi:hypothetical protein
MMSKTFPGSAQITGFVQCMCVVDLRAEHARTHRDPGLQHGVGAQPDGIETASRFQRPVEFRKAEGCITPEETLQVAP